MTRSLTLLALLAVTACSGTAEIDDPNMEASGAQLGSSTGALGTMDPAADDATIQSGVSTVGGNLQSLVTQHQAYASVNSVPDVDRDGLAQETTGTTSWDGSHLVFAQTVSTDGLDYVYDVDLTFTSGDAGSGVDGHYDFDFIFDYGGVSYAYVTHAKYDAVQTDGTGCATSGVISVDWSAKVDLGGLPIPGATNSNSKGTVVVTFDGCNAVTIEGTD